MREMLTPRMQWLNEVAEWEGKPTPFRACPVCGVLLTDADTLPCRDVEHCGAVPI